MYYNGVIELEITTDLAVEPVTLPDLKRHLNFQFDTTGSYLFNDDDTLLTQLLTDSRKILENYTGLSFGPKTLTAVMRNELGYVELPAGPKQVITSLVDVNGNAVGYQTRGRNFLQIQYPTLDYIVVVYTAGYAAGTLPGDLQRAIKMQCEFLYNNRGSAEPIYRVESVDICRPALELATPYKRTSFIA